MSTLFYGVTNLLGYIFFLSYKTGQIIVSALSVILPAFVKLVKTVWSVTIILSEDLYYFGTDVGNRLYGIALLFLSLGEQFVVVVTFLVFLLKHFVFGVCYLYDSIISAAVNSMNLTLINAGKLLEGLKQFLVVLGSGLWFLILVIPLTVKSICVGLLYCFERGIGGIVDVIRSAYSTTVDFFINAYVFVTDVPCEAVAGLIAFSCIMYVLVNFQMVLSGYALRASMLLFDKVCRFNNKVAGLLGRWKTYFRTRPKRTARVEPQREEKRERSTTENHHLCVVCQERIKDVLLMPCRHLCVCKVCCSHLRGYHRQCPLCRTSIKATIPVYI